MSRGGRGPGWCSVAGRETLAQIKVGWAGVRLRRVKELGPALLVLFSFSTPRGRYRCFVWKLPRVRTRRGSQLFLLLRNVEAFRNGRDSKGYPSRPTAESLPALHDASPLHAQQTHLPTQAWMVCHTQNSGCAGAKMGHPCHCPQTTTLPSPAR